MIIFWCKLFSMSKKITSVRILMTVPAIRKQFNPNSISIKLIQSSNFQVCYTLTER